MFGTYPKTVISDPLTGQGFSPKKNELPHFAWHDGYLSGQISE